MLGCCSGSDKGCWAGQAAGQGTVALCGSGWVHGSKVKLGSGRGRARCCREKERERETLVARGLVTLMYLALTLASASAWLVGTEYGY